MTEYLGRFIEQLIKKTPNEQEFHQAVQEIFESIMPVIESEPKYRQANILERLVVPERVIIFRVPWVDDHGEVRVNTGYRVEMNSVLGPYKGGLRFRSDVTLGMLKFLAFEQVFKNALLTTLFLGGGKGGSDFDPKNKSDYEVMRFCQAFMNELYRHLGPNTDVPAGDIGVGSREVGYLFGQYKKLANEFSGALTGKKAGWGGSLIRPEATGYGTVYFAEEMLKTRGDSITGKTVAISGSGNVAQYAAEKVIQLGGKVVTLSDSNGFIYDESGIDAEKLVWIMDLKNVRRGRIREYAEHFPGVDYLEGKRPWGVKCDIALPCATQNELNAADAETLVRNGCVCVAEGANMPTVPEGVTVFQAAKLLYGPAKAANAGGVAVSGLEMAQNAQFLSWPREEVEERLKKIMRSIHKACVKYGHEDKGCVDYVKGANIASFVRIADAMIDQGVV